MANQVDFKILPSDQFSVYSPSTRSDKIITYFTLLSKLRGDILAVSSQDDPNNIVSAYYSNVGGTQTLHLVKADGSEITASQSQQIISGTVNYVSKFTSSNDIGDSQIFDNGTNVGIGTTTMTHKLQLGTGGVFADYFQLDTTYSNGFVVGALSWDIDSGTADLGLSGSLKLKIGQDDVWYVKNQTGSTIDKGTAVYASGTLGASSKILITPMIADGSIPARFFLGIVAESIANGAEGYVLTKGKLRNINTNAYNEGDVLWVSPTVAGALTATEPTAPDLKLPVAFVVNKGNNGVLAIRATTGQRIADASDVDYTGAADNSFLVYDSATGVWVDEAVGIFKTIAVATQGSIVADAYDDTLTIAAGTGISITTAASTDTLTITNSAPDQVVSLTGAGTTVVTGTYPSFTITSNDEFDGTVTSVDLTAGTGISVSGGPITTSGSITVTNTAPDRVVSLTGAGTTSVTGTYPTFTITSDDQYDGTVTSVDLTAGTGISVSGGPITSSGSITVTNTAPDQIVALTAGTGISTSGTYPNFTITNSEPDQTVALTASTGISVTGTYPNFTIENTSPSSGGTVTSVDLTAGTGISVSGGPITTSGSITVTNTAPDQTVALTAGTGISTSGTYPNFTITNSAPDQTVSLTAGTGITTSGTYPSFTITNSAPDQTVALTAGTGITTSGTYPNFTITNAAPDQTVALTAGTGISVTGTYPNFTITNTSTSSGGTVINVSALTLGTTGTDLSSTVVNSTTTPVITLNVPTASATNRGALSSGDWITFNGKQNAITLTTTGTSGAATLIGATLNIPQYTDQYTGTVTSVGITAGTGILVSGSPITSSGSITVTNNDLGSSQDIFKTIAVSGQTNIVADSNNDTLRFAAGTGISITTDATTDTVTITNTAVTSIACFSAYSSTGVALTTDGALYDFGLDTETIKDSSVFTHSTSTDPDEITVLATGTYEISYSAAMINANATTNDAAVVNVYIYKNGSSLVTALNTVQNVAHLNTSNYNYYNQISNSYIVSLTANDVIKLVALPSYLGGAGSSYGVVFGYLGNNNVTIKKLG